MINLNAAIKRKRELVKIIREKKTEVDKQFEPELKIIERIIADGRKKGIGKRIKQVMKR